MDESKDQVQLQTLDYVSVADPSEHTADTEELIKSLDMDPYDEDETELRFLHSKPTCFIVIGKPGCGKTTLARRLATEWKCEFINASELINQHVELETEQGKKFREILQRGEAIPESLVIKMIESKINSPEVAHHGYVLDDFPCLSESYMSVRDQIELIKNWKLRPDFIINLKIPDKDIEKRRMGQKVDPVNGDIYTKDVYDPEKIDKSLSDKEEDEGGEEEEEEAEEGGEEEIEEDRLPSEILNRLIVRPEDLEKQVTEHILRYKNNMLRILEDYMADHDQQYLIEMDSNQTNAVLFKQLMMRLECFVLRTAAVPIRLWDQEDEEIPEDTETDELMRQLAPKQMIAPRFRWRRSRWLRNCPVALFEGKMVPGKPEFAVSFLDKIYCLSTAEAMEKFLKNPRPYLLPPQPRPPCKLSILGPPLSGKTTLAHLLANKYSAKVINVDELMKPKLQEEHKSNIQKLRDETTLTAITTVKNRIKEQLEAEREAELEAKAAAEAAAAEEAEDQEEGENAAEDEEEENEEEKKETETPTEKKIDTPESTAQSDASKEKIIEPEVDASHPEVIKIVEAAVKEAEKQETLLPPEVYIEMMETAIKDAERELKKSHPDGPNHGGWILDNFPNTRDQWAVCIEKNLLPDDVIILKDNSDNGSCLMERYYNLNKAEIDELIQKRVDLENAEKLKKEEEKRKQEELEKKLAEEAAKQKEEEKEDEGEGEEAEGDGEGEHEPTEQHSDNGDEEKHSTNGDSVKDDQEAEVQKDVKPEEVVFEPQMPSIPDGPEMDKFREKRAEYEKEFPSIQSTISGNTSIEPLNIDIEDQTVEDVFKTTVDRVEEPLRYQAWERSGIDIDEEDEDNENDIPEEEEEEAAEEEEDPSRGKNKRLGETNHFCCVSLKESNVLAPGNPETAAMYREKIYYFTSVENKDKFLENPTYYLPKSKTAETPPIRLLILGQKGAGKTLHGRNLARKLGLFHISFQDRLQELIISKTKRRIGPDYEEEPDPVLEEEEGEEGAITAPDGTSVADDVAEAESKESGQENEDGENEIELTEDEEAIKANLESDEPLPAEVLDNILPNWWHKEPFKSTGFILEGFPRTGDEVRYLADMGLYTDAAIILSVSDSDVIGRLLPPKLDAWKIKRDKRLAIKEKRKQIAKKKRDAAMQKRREEMLREKEERRLEKKFMAMQAEEEAERGYDDDEGSEEEELGEEEVEEEEEDDIEALLAEEFEEEEAEEEEEEELEEDAIDRMRNDLNEVYDADTNKLDSVMEALSEILIPRLEVDGGRKPHIVRYMLSKKLRPYTEYRHSLFERVYTIGERLAKNMLQYGYKQPSRFGRWCPVQLKDGECIQPMSGPGYPTYPCIYRQHIYYLSSLESREMFIQDPMTFLKQPSPKPVVPIRLAVIGPPKAGKTALCTRLAEEYGLLRLSIGEALRSLISSQPRSELAIKITDYLQTGATVPDELAVQALEMCLLDMKCQTRGYVLDGYPVTKRQVELLTERSIIPVRVVELCLDNKTVMVRGTKDRVSEDRVYPIHDSAQILAVKLAAYKSNVEEVRNWYKEEHRNYVSLPGDESKWWIWNTVLDVSKASVRQIQTYLQRIADGKAASIYDMCITPSEFEQRLGDFNQYCPVSLALRNELIDCSTHKTLQFAAEFRGHYYKMAGQKELDQFLETPEKFTPPLAVNKLPDEELLPKRCSPEDINDKSIELQGYCPVTYYEGKCRYEAIVPGNPEFIVEYKNKCYSCASEEKLLQFMKLPEQYCVLKLPHKLPPREEPLPVTSLPMLGFMEQTAASAIITSLTSVGNLKPKYPFLTSSKSALVYVAYHLKAFNPKSSDYVRKKYKKKLEKFQETCELINYLGDHMTVRYRDPKDRPSDFDQKLETFFALRGIEPTSTWIA